MKITILPFKQTNAFADIESQQVFVSNDWFTEENLIHELAHLISHDPNHDKNFRIQLECLGGTQPPDDDIFKKIRKRCGIPTNIAANIGNISGIQNILLDYHLLQSYRKFSKKILGTEGHWEVLNEGTPTGTGDSISAKDQLIRLYPTPKGAFPVVVLYIPVVTHFRSPQARQLTYEMMLAEAKIAVGTARRKISGMPLPDGGSISYDGSDLVQEGLTAKEKIVDQAIELGEPLGIYTW